MDYLKEKFDLKKRKTSTGDSSMPLCLTHNKKGKKLPFNYYHRQPFVAPLFYRFIYGNFKTIGLRSRHG